MGFEHFTGKVPSHKPRYMCRCKACKAWQATRRNKPPPRPEFIAATWPYPALFKANGGTVKPPPGRTRHYCLCLESRPQDIAKRELCTGSQGRVARCVDYERCSENPAPALKELGVTPRWLS